MLEIATTVMKIDNPMNQFNYLSAESPEHWLAKLSSEEIRECNEYLDTYFLSVEPVTSAERESAHGDR